MELTRFARTTGKASLAIISGLAYAAGYAIGTIAHQVLIVVDDAIGCVDWDELEPADD